MRLLGLLVVSLVLAACGDGYASIEPDNPDQASGGLVVTRADGSSYELEDAVAECRPSEQVPGLEVVRLTAPADVSSRRDPVLRVEAVQGVTGRHELPLQERDGDVGPSDVRVVAVDPRTDNTLSGSVPRAAGTITIHESTCDPEPRLSVTVVATLGSEKGLRPEHVRGGMASSGR